MQGRKRTDAPAAPHVGCHQALHDFGRPLRGYDAGPQAVTRIGPDRQHFLLFAVQRKGVKAQLLVPESVIESFEQHFRLLSQLFGTAGLAELIEYLGHASPGVINIALQFAERFWPFYERSVRVDDAVAGVLPTHVLVAHGGPGLILLESVAIAIAVTLDPGQAILGGLKMALEQRLVAGCPPGGVQRDE